MFVDLSSQQVSWARRRLQQLHEPGVMVHDAATPEAVVWGQRLASQIRDEIYAELDRAREPPTPRPPALAAGDGGKGGKGASTEGGKGGKGPGLGPMGRAALSLALTVANSHRARSRTPPPPPPFSTGAPAGPSHPQPAAPAPLATPRLSFVPFQDLHFYVVYYLLFQHININIY